MAQVIPVAEMLGLRCPDCGWQLEDRLGPFWCQSCEKPVSSWVFVAAMLAALAKGRDDS